MKGMLGIIKHFLSEPAQTGSVTGRFYRRTGACRGCGRCCTQIYLVHGDETITTLDQFERLKPFNPDYASFEPVDETEHGLLFRCRHLQADARCAQYEKRPLFCRRYPSEASLLMGGALAETCGYRFEPLLSFREVLAREAHSPSA